MCDDIKLVKIIIKFWFDNVICKFYYELKFKVLKMKRIFMIKIM